MTPSWIAELAAAAHAKGSELLDAPVTGSKTHAAAGELNFLVGGSDAALEKSTSRARRDEQERHPSWARRAAARCSS